MDELNQESSAIEHENDLIEEPDRTSSQSAPEALLVVETERDDYKDRMQRAQAELINFRRRTADERVEIVRKEKARFVSTLLPVLDDLALAMNQPERLIANPTWIEGIELIYRRMSKSFTGGKSVMFRGIAFGMQITVHFANGEVCKEQT